MTRTGISWLTLLAVCLTPACSDASTTAAEVEKTKGSSGHSCQADDDCSEGLACIDEKCDLVEFGLTDTGNECKLVTCTTPLDCCPEPHVNCAAWQQACALGESASCLNYESPSNNCVCNESLLECADNQCVVHECLTSANCCGAEPPECAELEQNCQLGDTVSCELLADPGTGCCDASAWTCTANKTCSPACQDDLGCVGYGVCSFGICVECRDAADCATGETCSESVCVGACLTDSHCAAFHTCSAGQCVESGCIHDSECVALLKDVRAVCTDTRCVLPCETDAGCDDPSDFSFQVCVDGLCTILGCSSDQECRIRYGVSPGASWDAICVPKGI